MHGLTLDTSRLQGIINCNTGFLGVIWWGPIRGPTTSSIFESKQTNISYFGRNQWPSNLSNNSHLPSAHTTWSRHPVSSRPATCMHPDQPNHVTYCIYFSPKVSSSCQLVLFIQHFISLSPQLHQVTSPANPSLRHYTQQLFFFLFWHTTYNYTWPHTSWHLLDITLCFKHHKRVMP